jgi:hypothetical protein
MSGKVDIKTVGIELAKTVVGFGVGRIVVVQAEKALKLEEQTDPKKKKLMEVGVGVGVAAVGTAIALKAPPEFASVGAGMATAGVIAAVSPFGKDDKGLIPVLHGYDEEGNLIEIESDLNAVESEDERAEREYKEFLASEQEEDEDDLGAIEDDFDEDEDEDVPSSLNGAIESLN